MRRPVALAAGTVALLVVVVLAAGYAYYFSNLRSTPRPLSLSSVSPAPAASASPAVGALAGTWSVGSGSVARYRVNEVFAGQTSNHEAVAETQDVTGSLTLQPGSGQTVLGELKISAQLTGLHSVDSVSGLGLSVSQRDRIVQQALATSQYPSASFTAENVQLPGTLDATTAGLSIPGQLTIHGVTRPEQITIKQVQVAAGSAQVVGQTAFDTTDFSVQPPALPITRVQPQVTLEFQLNLSHA